MPYPETKPYNEGFLPVSELHTLHYMQCGNPDGKPVIFLHGGPGGAIGINQTVWFNPEIYRVILFSQRGCGKSTPYVASVSFLRDLEVMCAQGRRNEGEHNLGPGRVNLTKGSTLALAYAQTHPESCIALCLRGIFLFRKKEVDFFWRNGTNWIWPEEWEEFVKPVDASKRELDSFLPAYHALLTHSDDEISLDAAKRWSRWESQVARLHQDHEAIAKSDTDPRWARTFALMECHYSLNNAFMPDGHLITEAQLAKIRHIPCIVVQGRYDMVCPFQSAYDLSKAWGKGLSLRVAHDSGHSASEPSTSKLLTEAMDELASI